MSISLGMLKFLGSFDLKFPQIKITLSDMNNFGYGEKSKGILFFPLLLENMFVLVIVTFTLFLALQFLLPTSVESSRISLTMQSRYPRFSSTI